MDDASHEQNTGEAASPLSAWYSQLAALGAVIQRQLTALGAGIQRQLTENAIA